MGPIIDAVLPNQRLEKAASRISAFGPQLSREPRCLKRRRRM
jgi:hypothetical protein